VNANLSPAKIYLVVGTGLGTLVVFYTNAHCWQFRIATSFGGVFGLRRIYYTAEAAERAGREWIKKGGLESW
jgi:hypothetical protein